MKANEIMTAPVITISPGTPVREIAALLVERRISGVPVVEDGRVVGLRCCNAFDSRGGVAADSTYRQRQLL